jgi:hypothetical protein
MAEALHGLLFVHLDDDPPALADALPAALREPKLQACRFQAETSTDIDANWKLVMEQILAEPPSDIERTVAWPCLVLETRGDGAVLHQVIARSFHRTRIHHHHYGAIAAEEVAARAAQWQAGASARQAALEAGGAPAVPGSPELEDFRRRVRTAHAAGPQR